MFVAECGNVPNFCGTSAKLSADDGYGIVGVDTYMSQVVSTTPENKKLKFFMHWVAHEVDPLQVNVYGGNSPDGPWVSVWQPFHQVVLKGPSPPRGEPTSYIWPTRKRFDVAK